MRRGNFTTLPHGEITRVLRRSIKNGIRNKLSKRFTRRCVTKKNKNKNKNKKQQQQKKTSDARVAPNQSFLPNKVERNRAHQHSS